MRRPPTASRAINGKPATGFIIGETKHGDRSFFSDNWPTKARHWLPTIDHPYDKARSEMIVTAPAHYQVVSNGLLVEETDLADGRRVTHWRQSVPIPVWLNALGVARFAVQHLGEVEGVPVETWVFAADRDAGFHGFAVPTPHALEFFAHRVGPTATRSSPTSSRTASAAAWSRRRRSSTVRIR
jgi:aminopeptidase N